MCTALWWESTEGLNALDAPETQSYRPGETPINVTFYFNTGRKCYLFFGVFTRIMWFSWRSGVGLFLPLFDMLCVCVCVCVCVNWTHIVPTRKKRTPKDTCNFFFFSFLALIYRCVQVMWDKTKKKEVPGLPCCSPPAVLLLASQEAV